MEIRNAKATGSRNLRLFIGILVSTAAIAALVYVVQNPLFNPPSQAANTCTSSDCQQLGR